MNDTTKRMNEVNFVRNKLYAGDAGLLPKDQQPCRTVSEVMKRFTNMEARNNRFTEGSIIQDAEGNKFYIDEVDPYSHALLLLSETGVSIRATMRDYLPLAEDADVRQTTGLAVGQHVQVTGLNPELNQYRARAVTPMEEPGIVGQTGVIAFAYYPTSGVSDQEINMYRVILTNGGKKDFSAAELGTPTNEEVGGQDIVPTGGVKTETLRTVGGRGQNPVRQGADVVKYGPASGSRVNPRPKLAGTHIPGANEDKEPDGDDDDDKKKKGAPKGDEDDQSKPMILNDKKKKVESRKVGEMVVHTESQKCGVITQVKEDMCDVVFNDGSHGSIPSDQISMMGQPKTFMSTVPSLGLAGRTSSTRVLYGKDVMEGSRVMVNGDKGVVIGFPTMTETEQKARVLFDSGREEVVDFLALKGVDEASPIKLAIRQRPPEGSPLAWHKPKTDPPSINHWVPDKTTHEVGHWPPSHTPIKCTAPRSYKVNKK